jgi:hypothetical protein
MTTAPSPLEVAAAVGQVAAPWTIDEDNDARIVVKDDRGEVVHHAEFADIPSGFSERMRALMIAQERANCRAMVAAVNAATSAAGR